MDVGEGVARKERNRTGDSLAGEARATEEKSERNERNGASLQRNPLVRLEKRRHG